MSYTVQKQELQQCRQEVPARSLQVFSPPQHHQFVCGKHQDLLEAIPVELIVIFPTKKGEKEKKKRNQNKALDFTPLPGTNFRWNSEDSTISLADDTFNCVVYNKNCFNLLKQTGATKSDPKK